MHLTPPYKQINRTVITPTKQEAIPQSNCHGLLIKLTVFVDARGAMDQNKQVFGAVL